MNLHGSKATPVGDIPTDIKTIDIHLPTITQIIDRSIDNNCYPCDLKLAEVSPVSKKKNDLDRKNYRPVSFFISCVKVLRKNYVPTNKRFHKRQIVKSFNRL